MTHNDSQWLANESMKYHLNQWQSQKESTIAFEKFISQNLRDSKSVLDLGCGAGAPTSYLANRHPDVLFEGIDLETDLIDTANALVKGSNLENITFSVGDILNLRGFGKGRSVDGVVSFQTLSWLSGYEKAMKQITKHLSPEWVAVTSLFYEGNISCHSIVREAQGRTLEYNTYSLSQFEKYTESLGYRLSHFEPFNISIDIPKPANRDTMGTYTLRALSDGIPAPFRLQISGPLLLNWAFVLLTRK